jgi:Transposase and inactivated derivatives
MSISEWRSQAACRTADPELFFPSADNGPAYAGQVAAAKAICAGCPVRVSCLDEALERIPFGIAGGLTPEERRRSRDRAVLSAAEVLEVGLRPDARRVEVEAAGRLLLADGHTPNEVARRCGVAERTVTRWIARMRAEAAATADRRTEGSHGGNRAPLLISHSHGPLAGNTSNGRARS